MHGEPSDRLRRVGSVSRGGAALEERTVHEVVLRNAAGWTQEVADEFQSFEGVSDVRLSHRLPNGRSELLVVRFPRLEDATAFAEANAEATAPSKGT